MTEHNIITIFFIDRFYDGDADADDGSSGDDGSNDGLDDFFVKVLMMVCVKMIGLMMT